MTENSGKAKILIVDDEVLIAADLKSRLQKLGYTVCAQATSGEQALKLVEQHQPDLVMMDIVIQGDMDGIDAAEVIRDRWGIPVVFLTAYADTDRLERAKLTYPFGYLLKPFQDRDLRITTEMALYVAKVDAERRKAERELEYNKERLHTALGAANSGTWEWDLNTNENYWSDELWELYCLEPHSFEPSYESWRKSIHPDDRERVEEAVKQAAAEFSSLKTEWRVNTSDGTERWLMSRGNPIMDENGVPQRYLGVVIDITDRKQTEEALKKSEEMYRLLAVNSTDLITMFKNHDIVYVSPAIETILGYSPSEFLQMDHKDLFHPDEKENLIESINNRITTMDINPITYEYRQKHKKGHFVWLETTLKNKVIEDGYSVSVLNTRDITDRKQTEEEARKRQNMLARTERIANMGSWEWNVASDTIIWSEGMFRIFSLDPSVETPGFDEHSSIIHPEDRALGLKMVERAISEGEPYEIEVRGIRSDGEPRILKVHGFPERGPTGQVERIFGSTQDITDRKHIEEELLERNNIFKKAEEMGKLGSFKWDIASDTCTFSDQWLNIHGCLSAPKSSEELLPIAHPDDKPIIEKELNEAIQGLKPYNLVHRIIRQNDGAIRWGKAYGEIQFDDSGNAVSMYGIGQDITELKEIENELKSSLKEKETLLLEIHHRVRNNMQVIISLMSLQSDKINDEQLKVSFLETQNRIYAMSAVHEVLHQSDNLSSVDLSEYLSKLGDTTFQTYRTDCGNIQFSAEIQPIPVDLEKSYPIGLVINELLSNSLKYAFSEGQDGEISISGQLEENTAKLVVSDTGVGIPEDFDWRDTDSLGLQIVRSLVEDQLRGTIDLDRTNGTKWTITFPV